MVRLVRQLLAERGQATLMVESDSMEPILSVGQQIQIESVSADQLQCGDMITVVASDALYTHRYFCTLSHKGKRFLVTRGDQPLAYDPTWTESQLLGRVVACEKRSGWLSLRRGGGRWLNTHLTHIARFENWLYDDSPLDPERFAMFETRLLGRWWRQDRWRHMILRAMRGFWLRWSRLWVFITVIVAAT